MGHYGVYTRLSAYQDWISGVTEGAVRFKDVPPVQLSEQQRLLIDELDRVLDAAKGRIKIFPTFGNQPRISTPYKIKIASELSGHLLLISVVTNGNITQLFPFVDNQLDSSRVEGRITIIPPDELHMHYSTENSPGEEQIIGIVVPDIFHLDKTFDLAKFMTQVDLNPNDMIFNEAEKLEYLIAILDMIIATAKPEKSSDELNLDGWGYDRIVYQVINKN